LRLKFKGDSALFFSCDIGYVSVYITHSTNKNKCTLLFAQCSQSFEKDTYPYHTLILVCLTAMVQKTTLKTFYVFMGSLNILSGCHRLVNEWEALKCICGGQCWYVASHHW